MDRRGFLTLASAGVAGGLSLLGTEQAKAASPEVHPARQRISYDLPKSETPRWAWTIDDGVSSASIATYLAHALRNPEIKFTYFVTSMYPSWKQNASALRELMQRGQVQLANHTHTHKDLRTLSGHGIQKQLLDCHHFLEDEFGASSKSFWRPPYGFWDIRVLDAAAEAGFTAPTMWFGVFGTDSATITANQLYDNVQKWVQNGRIVLDHANYTLGSEHFAQMMAIIRPKGLQMVTLTEAFPSY